jgi:hypothetical protein
MLTKSLIFIVMRIQYRPKFCGESKKPRNSCHAPWSVITRKQKIPQVLTQKCYPLFKGWSHCVKYSSVKLSLGCGSSGLCPWQVWQRNTLSITCYALLSTSTTCSMQRCPETTHKMPKRAKCCSHLTGALLFNSLLCCYSLYYFRLVDVRKTSLKRRCKSTSICHQSGPK